MLLRLMGNYSQMGVGIKARPYSPPGFPPLIANIFETHVYIVSKLQYHYEEMFGIFPQFLSWDFSLKRTQSILSTMSQSVRLGIRPDCDR